MATIRFTANLRRYVDCPALEVAAGTVGEALQAVFADNPRLRGYVVDEHGALRKHMVVFVDGVAVGDRRTLSDTLAADAKVDVFQALTGG